MIWVDLKGGAKVFNISIRKISIYIKYNIELVILIISLIVIAWPATKMYALD